MKNIRGKKLCIEIAHAIIAILRAIYNREFHMTFHLSFSGTQSFMSGVSIPREC